ncbi:outer membrane beta-barrel protein [Flavobacterium sp. GA093]|uniref:Outer membrane beta-barrel protein n=1 Tax=Flavobacterium hydrocarbonoxydans TaxID=2683249 RepID=A0A6I4NH36_9FLAO|nr:outer membrane beta-barrel protein [Flavobacterium hydrocarbonoxydans]MWB93860.1 outer membrane beta-barrel protein [Flavobacterium hydrocarbonoxydans]
MFKKITFVLFTAFLSLTTTQAQVTFTPGVHAGINLSKITSSDLGNKTDFYVGAFGSIKFSKIYSLQPELTYSRQGGKGTTSMGSTTTYNPETGNYITVYQNGTVDASLQYFSAVTINKLNFTDDIYVLVGPFFDILLADDFKVDPKSQERNFNKGEDVDLGIVGGLGYSLKNGISFEARVKKGIGSAFTNYHASGMNDSNNLVFQFGATYAFGKK